MIKLFITCLILLSTINAFSNDKHVTRDHLSGKAHDILDIMQDNMMESYQLCLEEIQLQYTNDGIIDYPGITYKDIEEMNVQCRVEELTSIRLIDGITTDKI